jgi:hypothetical protein
MGTFKSQAAAYAVATFAVTGLSACNDTAFQTAAPAALAQVNPLCSVGTTKKNIRVMFMIDNSGSVATTDPSKKYSVPTLQKFIADYGANSNLTYNFAYFSGTTTKAVDMVTGKVTTAISAIPTNAIGTSAELSSVVATYDTIKPDSIGGTPYKSAFTTLTATIAADEAAGNKQDYAVVFMSDGAPTDISGAANLKALVDTVTKSASVNGSSVTLTTVYFGPDNSAGAISNLTTMATEGAGQFVDTNKLASGGLVINDILNVPGGVCL